MEENDDIRTNSINEMPGAWPSTRYDFSNRVKGATGLMNLGNTCFMNSALQCLSNTKPLKDYFYSQNYRQEINYKNPLGMQGELAEAFGELIDKLWKQFDSISPRDFKYKIGKFAPAFMGYLQHDCQELMAFLLDGLHEDLNRIYNKPYVETPERKESETESDFASRLWDLHKARNDSIIVDLFQGQYKSRLECPACKTVSVVFDPFMYLSVPLPVEKVILLNVTIVFLDAKKNPTNYGIVVPSDTKIFDFLKLVSKKAETEKDLKMVEVFQGKIYHEFTSNEFVKGIQPNDVIFIYEVNSPKRVIGVEIDISNNNGSDDENHGNRKSPDILESFVIPVTLECHGWMRK